MIGSKNVNTEYERLRKWSGDISERTKFRPKLALVLGSGLGHFAACIKREIEIDYRELEGFPVSTAPGHEGKFVFGYVKEVPIVAMQGRVHYYEGYEMSEVVMPIRLMGMLGAKVLFLTNAAGGLRKGMNVGDLMLIRDQVSLFVPSPLRGSNDKRLGTRFPDMSEIYSAKLRDVIRRVAKKLDIPILEGVYVQTPGPEYESPAETEMLKSLGCDAVAMSTACEAIAGVHLGMEVCGVSCISNPAAGMGETLLSHEEISGQADRAAPLFQMLVSESIREICADPALGLARESLR